MLPLFFAANTHFQLLDLGLSQKLYIQITKTTQRRSQFAYGYFIHIKEFRLQEMGAVTQAEEVNIQQTLQKEKLTDVHLPAANQAKQVNDQQGLTATVTTPGLGHTVRVLAEGHSGSDVEELQTALTTLGYPVEIDRIFGAETKQQVMNFQRDQNLVIDGEAGGATQQRILDLLPEAASGTTPTVTGVFAQHYWYNK